MSGRHDDQLEIGRVLHACHPAHGHGIGQPAVSAMTHDPAA